MQVGHAAVWAMSSLIYAGTTEVLLDHNPGPDYQPPPTALQVAQACLNSFH